MGRRLASGLGSREVSEASLKRARELGAELATHCNGAYMDTNGVAMIAAALDAWAKEKLAAWMIEHSFATGHGDTFEDLLKELSWQVAEARQKDIQIVHGYISMLQAGHIKEGLREATPEEIEFGTALLEAVAADIKALEKR